MKKSKFFSIVSVVALSMALSVVSLKKTAFYQMIADNVEALSNSDIPRFYRNTGTCGMLFQNNLNGGYEAWCKTTKYDVEHWQESGWYDGLTRTNWCCDSCSSSSYCD